MRPANTTVVTGFVDPRMKVEIDVTARFSGTGKREREEPMATVMITGANRGIGLEMTREYAADGWRVLACCREPDKAKT